VIVSILRIPVAEGLRFEAVLILRSVRRAILAQPGCRDCIVLEQQAPESGVVLIEAWESAEAFEAHLASEEHCHILSAVRLSGCASEAFCGSHG
jgi:quinol monooxygenase YgiN